MSDLHPSPVRAVLGGLSRSRAVIGAVAVMALALTLLQGAPAHANRTDVPPGSTVQINGKGFGHGKGMSQHGAQGAAQQGLSYRDIIEFYYPGTQWGTVKTRLRVKITAATRNVVVVMNRSHLRVRDVRNGVVHMLPDNGAKRWRLRVNANNRTVVQWTKPGVGWKRWKAFPGVAQFAAGGRPMTLVVMPGKKVDYRGVIRLARNGEGPRQRDTVNIIAIENYLRGVVPLEMPASWHPQAVRSQAVAARTYATFEQARPLAGHYQICDTTRCQVYGGASAEHPLSDAAIKATANQIVTHGGEAAFTQFSASNGNWAVAGSMPYQVAKHDPYDNWSGNTVNSWQVTLPPSRFESVWPQLGRLQAIRVNSRDGNGLWNGRVQRLTLIGSNRNVNLTGDELRSALGLRSTWINFRVQLPRSAGTKH